MHSDPLAYFITFRTYASWLLGDERGSVHHSNTRHGTPGEEPSPRRRTVGIALSTVTPSTLDVSARKTVLRSIRDICDDKHWHLYAAHVRTNHVHLVVQSEVSPERTMNALKSWAT